MLLAKLRPVHRPTYSLRQIWSKIDWLIRGMITTIPKTKLKSNLKINENKPFGLTTTNLFRGINSLLPSLKLKDAPERWMVGRLYSFPFGFRPIFKGVLVSFRECSFRKGHFFCGDNYHCKLAGWNLLGLPGWRRPKMSNGKVWWGSWG